MKVIEKSEVLEGMQRKDNIEDIIKFISYNNKEPLYTPDGIQLQVIRAGMNSKMLYVSMGDWIIKQHGNIVRVVSNEKFNKEYAEVR